MRSRIQPYKFCCCQHSNDFLWKGKGTSWKSLLEVCFFSLSVYLTSFCHRRWRTTERYKLKMCSVYVADTAQDCAQQKTRKRGLLRVESCLGHTWPDACAQDCLMVSTLISQPDSHERQSSRGCTLAVWLCYKCCQPLWATLLPLIYVERAYENKWPL